jgi:hypothetical protein
MTFIMVEDVYEDNTVPTIVEQNLEKMTFVTEIPYIVMTGVM